MFLQASVCPQGGVHDEGGVYGKLGACMAGGMCGGAVHGRGTSTAESNNVN